MISRMVLMFQREVAERIRALPGDDAYGALSVFTALYWRSICISPSPREVFIRAQGGRRSAGFTPLATQHFRCR